MGQEGDLGERRGTGQSPEPPEIPPWSLWGMGCPKSPLRAVPTLCLVLRSIPCLVRASTALFLFSASPSSFFPLERTRGATSCPSLPQPVLPSLQGQDKPHSAN